MTLSKIKKMKDERGFTIVELLIVIVVIAILAAIVIVAYNGIQTRARDTQNKTDAASIVKVAESRNADLGSYPSGADSAALITSFNGGTTAKLPSGVTITRVTAAPTTYATVLSAAEPTGNTARSYSVWTCATGVNVYYPQRSDSTIQVANAGALCT